MIEHEQTSPSSVLFLSCDIVGSTHYKQQSTGIWQRTFLAFYREFPQALASVCARDDGFKGAMTLWKAVGDELIFRVVVKDETEVSLAVRSWLQAMNEYEISSLASERLSTKGGAFIATFPGPDSESSIPRNPQTENSDKDVVALNREALSERDTDRYLFDYFGPSVDTGFRVASHSTQRYFTLSVEVAWALAYLREDQPAGSTLHAFDDIVFRGPQQLKGVWNGREYPIFAIDRHAHDDVNVALAQLQDDSVLPYLVAKLCRECCRSEGWPSKLYLPNSLNAEFRAMPVDPISEKSATDVTGFESEPTEEGMSDPTFTKTVEHVLLTLAKYKDARPKVSPHLIIDRDHRTTRRVEEEFLREIGEAKSDGSPAAEGPGKVV